MKKRTMISLIAFSLLASSSIAWAEGRYKTIEVFFDKINIKINGQQANLTKDSIIYDGSVYVPLKNLSELLGATVSWDNANRSVNLDFIVDLSSQAFYSSQQGIYQYITIEYNQTMSGLVEQMKNNNAEGMKTTISRFEGLRDIAKDIKDDVMVQSLEKMIAATELLRSGWDKKNLDQYYLAWDIFKANAAKINELLAVKAKDASEVKK